MSLWMLNQVNSWLLNFSVRGDLQIPARAPRQKVLAAMMTRGTQNDQSPGRREARKRRSAAQDQSSTRAVKARRDLCRFPDSLGAWRADLRSTLRLDAGSTCTMFFPLLISVYKLNLFKFCNYFVSWMWIDTAIFREHCNIPLSLCGFWTQ